MCIRDRRWHLQLTATIGTRRATWDTTPAAPHCMRSIIGCDRLDSASVELAAIIWATIYATQHPPPIDQHMLADSANATQRLSQVQDSTDPLTRLAQVIFHTAKQRHRVAIHRAHGHDDHPW
eukprot:5523812-Pyramimonas_sp.AAC.1